MKILAVFLIIFAVIIFVFRSFISNLINDASQPDQNPQLVSYLQGDWGVKEDKASIFKIKRDSLIEFRNDSISGFKTLRYLFKEAASKYFTKDSSFDFSSTNLTTSSFKLIGTNNQTDSAVIYILNRVSKSEIRMTSAGTAVTLIRINKD